MDSRLRGNDEVGTKKGQLPAPQTALDCIYGSARHRIDRPRARYLSCRRRWLCRERHAGGVEDDRRGLRAEPIARIHPRRNAGAGRTGPARQPAYQRGAHPDRARPAIVRRRDDAGARTLRGGAGCDRGACRASWPGGGGAGGDDCGAVRPVGLCRPGDGAQARGAAALDRLHRPVADPGDGGAGQRGRQRREPRHRFACGDDPVGTDRGGQLHDRDARRADAGRGAGADRAAAGGGPPCAGWCGARAGRGGAGGVE